MCHLRSCSSETPPSEKAVFFLLLYPTPSSKIPLLPLVLSYLNTPLCMYCIFTIFTYAILLIYVLTYLLGFHSVFLLVLKTLLTSWNQYLLFFLIFNFMINLSILIHFHISPFVSWKWCKRDYALYDQQPEFTICLPLFHDLHSWQTSVLALEHYCFLFLLRSGWHTSFKL